MFEAMHTENKKGSKGILSLGIPLFYSWRCLRHLPNEGIVYHMGKGSLCKSFTAFQVLIAELQEFLGLTLITRSMAGVKIINI